MEFYELLKNKMKKKTINIIEKKTMTNGYFMKAKDNSKLFQFS